MNSVAFLVPPTIHSRIHKVSNIYKCFTKLFLPNVFLRYKCLQTRTQKEFYLNKYCIEQNATNNIHIVVGYKLLVQFPLNSSKIRPRKNKQREMRPNDE